MRQARRVPSIMIIAVLLAAGAVRPDVTRAQGGGGQGGPVPMPLQVRVTPAPTGPVITWQPVNGATGYTLYRWKRNSGQGRCCEQQVRSLTGARYIDTTRILSGTYIYRVVAHLGGGRRGFEERIVQLAAQGGQARNPADFTAVQTGPGTVTLRWRPVSGSLFYQLSGPGAGAEGLRVNGGSHVLAGVPEGRHEWQLVTLYPPGIQPDFQNPSRASATVGSAQPPQQEVAASPPPPAAGDRDTLPTIALSPREGLPQRMPPGGAPAPLEPTASVPAMPTTGAEPAPSASSGPRVEGRRLVPVASPAAPTPSAPAAGRYLVTVTGLRTGYTTKDGIGLIDQDGKGDEIMAAAFVRRYDRTSAQPLEYTSLQTMVYGDINGYQRERVQAGRLTVLGGITDGDPIPADAPVARTMPAQISVFPWKLWEGTLTDGADALVISPSIWEYDGNPVDFHAWHQNQQALTNSIFLAAKLQRHIDERRFAPLELGANETSTDRFEGTMRFLAEGGIGAALGLPPLSSILGRQRDRPIGLVPNGQNNTALPNTTVVLTREIIEAALATPPGGVVNPMPYILVPMVKPGLMVINFRDGVTASTTTPFDFLFDRKAFYSMVLQVERIP